MNLNSNELSIEGSKIIGENIFFDERGLFTRLFDDRRFSQTSFQGVKNINLSKNISKGTIRGLHMQKSPASETKIFLSLIIKSTFLLEQMS